MKQGTKLIFAFVGAGVAANLLLSKTVAEATSAHPTLAAGGEGLTALGAGYWAYRARSMTAAVIGGVAAGLLVDSLRTSMAPVAAPMPVAVGEPTGPLTSTAIGSPAVLLPRPTATIATGEPTKVIQAPPIVSPPIRQELLR